MSKHFHLGRVFTVLGVVLVVELTHAYEPDLTHREMSSVAARKSKLLGDPTLLEDLGLKSYSVDQDFSSPTRRHLKRVEVVIGQGAFWEDEANFLRPPNHFFDPTRNLGLWPYCGLNAACVSSPEWTLAKPGARAFQRNSYADARVSFLRALVAPSRADRSAAWGRTFETLGHVIHHIQDMAQPQHVRNDPHLDLEVLAWTPLFNPSRYEAYTAYPIVHQRVRALASQGESVWSPARISVLDEPRAFWTNRSGAGLADFTNLNFVSQGSNFEVGSNGQSVTNNARYVLPAPSTTTAVTIGDLFRGANEPVPVSLRGQCGSDGQSCEIDFVGNLVTDLLSNGTSTINPRASSLSVFDQELRFNVVPYYNGCQITSVEFCVADTQVRLYRAFALNRFNFDAAHEYLIPTAVSYSAGMLDYFFRGRLDAAPEPGPQNGYRVKNIGPQAMSGTFEFYYDDAAGNRHPVPGGRFEDVVLPVWSSADPNGSSRVFTFDLPTSPAPKTPHEYMLVFQGDMGKEQADPGQSVIGAVAAKLIVPKPEVFVVGLLQNNTYSLYKSVDLGVSWQPLLNRPQDGLKYLGGKALAAMGALSTDGGITWSALPSGRIGTPIDSQTQIDATRYQSPPNTWPPYYAGVIYSADRGLNWSAPTTFQDIEHLQHIVSLGQDTLIAQGSRYQTPNPVSCPPPFSGFGCLVLERALYHSSNRGASWSRSNIGENLSSAMVHLGKRRLVNGKLIVDAAGGETLMSERYLGAAGNYQSELVISLDGGLTWQPFSSSPAEVAVYGDPDYWTLWHLAYGGGDLIFAYFHNGAWPNYKQRLYKSTDAGATWVLAGDLPPETAPIGVTGIAVKPANEQLPNQQ